MGEMKGKKQHKSKRNHTSLQAGDAGGHWQGFEASGTLYQYEQPWTKEGTKSVGRQGSEVAVSIQATKWRSKNRVAHKRQGHCINTGDHGLKSASA